MALSSTPSPASRGDQIEIWLLRDELQHIDRGSPHIRKWTRVYMDSRHVIREIVGLLGSAVSLGLIVAIEGGRKGAMCYHHPHDISIDASKCRREVSRLSTLVRTG